MYRAYRGMSELLSLSLCLIASPSLLPAQSTAEEAKQEAAAAVDDLDDVFDIVPLPTETEEEAQQQQESTAASPPSADAQQTPPPAAELPAAFDPAFRASEESDDFSDVFDIVPLEEVEDDAGEAGEGEDYRSSKPEFSSTGGPVVLAPELRPLSYHGLLIQFGEHRVSASGKDEFWGAVGLQVKILGTDNQLTTDVRGQAFLQGVPAGGELLLYAYDQAGIYQSMIHEVAVPEQREAQVTEMYSLERTQIRTATFQSWLSAVGIADSDGGDICGEIRLPSEERAATAGYQVVVDAAHQGVYYFNEQGLLDVHLTESSPLGRFCVFGVAPGEVVVDLHHKERPVSLSQLTTSTPIGLTFITFHQFSSFHTRLPYILTPSPLELVTRAPLPHPLPPRSVHPPPLVTLEAPASGTVSEEPWAQHFSVHPSTWEGYIHVTAQEQKWQPLLFRLPAWSWRSGVEVLPLLARGFMTELTQLMGLPYHRGGAHLWISHGLREAQQHTSPTAELWDDKGRQYSSPWNKVGEEGVLYTGYFNLEEGRYLWILKDASGRWLASKIIKALPGITSVSHSGRPFVYKTDLP